ncbi:MAG: glycosyl transferase group 1, partial [candidate division NC10 bacterium]|nr:glycosyl transferase group 1 [candidate division NC10 bacterium]
MRVLIVTPQFLPLLGGAERQAHALGRMLGERGHRVAVLTRRVAGLPRREVMDGVSVERGIWAVEVGPLYGLTYTLSVSRFLLSHRSAWDVVHITHIYLDAFAATLTGRWRHYGDLARLARLRAWPLYPGPGKVALRALIRTIARADAFIANSREVREELVAAGCPGGKIAHIPNGVDLTRFHPDPAARAADGRRRLGLPDGPLVVFAGRLDPQKGLHTLVAAMRSPALAAAGAHMLLLGDGPQRADLAQAVERDGLADRVLFRGVVE